MVVLNFLNLEIPSLLVALIMVMVAYVVVSRSLSYLGLPRKDDLQFEELKGMAASLCRILECAVCLAVLQKDMVTCVNGHSICTKCHTSIQPDKLCPTCREGFSNIKQNSLARQVLDVIPHTCRHTIDCPYFVRPGDDHESYCYFKIIHCEFCRQEVQVVNLEGHVKDNHPKEEKFLGKGYERYESYYDLEQTAVVTNKLLLSSYGHYLWIIENINPTAGVINFQFIPVFCGKPEHDISVKIVFRSDQTATHKPGYEASTVVKMNSNVKPTEENSLLVPFSVAKRFYLQDSKSFFFYITLSKTKQ